MVALKHLDVFHDLRLPLRFFFGLSLFSLQLLELVFELLHAVWGSITTLGPFFQLSFKLVL